MTRTKHEIFIELLVIQAQSGNARAVDELAAHFHPRFLDYATRIVGDAESARDVVQEAWLSIIRGIHKLQDSAAFRSWAYRIVHHKSVDIVRRESRVRRELELYRKSNSPVDESSQTHFAADEQNRDLHLLRGEIRKLSQRDQTVLRLFYEEQLSLKEISYVTGDTVSAIKSRLFQLRKNLKTKIERQNHEPEQP